ncbi:hypothetical protein [Zavarzinella formosa]|uniref:hypothetical protein n=1 Tax=Zavarzinella formosa TaxID=360055 RepID=UPI0002F9EFA8|nr:hypothetical protein [Zavarzinella formosa]
MAKKKKETGPGPVMIMFLVFFILSTTALGVTTYLGFESEGQAREETKKAVEDKKQAEKKFAEETARRNVDRIAMGIEDPQDREDIAGAAKEHNAVILEEHKRITDRLTGAFPTKDAFRWPLIDDLRGGGTGGEGDKKPAPAPNKTVPSIAKEWAKMYLDADKKLKDAAIALQNADAQKKAADDRAVAAKTTFDTKLAELDATYKGAIAKLTADFNNLKVEADKAGTTFAAKAADWAVEKADLEGQIQKMGADKKDLKEKLVRAQNPDPTDFETRFKHLDLVKLEERKGEIAGKADSKSVTLQFNSRNILAVGQTFMVLAPDKSLVTVIEREKALEKDHRDRRGLFDREPFTNNEQIKGMVEITEVTGAYSARARIVSQAESIRDPISKKDSIYNITLTGNSREHVAYCGIIDLDGDGLPNNEEFVRILEKNGVIVDAYLDLKTGEIKGRGMNAATKFLILGPDAPEVGKVKEMMNKAKENGIQIVDARKFLKLIGVTLPANPIPPRYSTTNIVGDGAAPMGDAPAAKKDEVPPPAKKGE